MRIVVLDDYQAIARELADWGSLGDDVVVEFLHRHVADPDELVALIGDADVVVTMRERTPMTRALLQRLPRLRLLLTTGMVNNVIDMEAAAELDITVCGTGGILSPTAELTWGLIIGLLRHIPAEDAAIRAGGWQHTIGPGLSGKRLGIVGLGRLGSAVARVGQAFDMDVVAWSQNLTEERCAEVGVSLVTKDELFSTADVISVHLWFSERSRGTVGAAELALMKSTAVIVNTSRSAIVDEAALVAALGEGRIAGAAIDVFDIEPLPADHRLRSLPNTVITPHIGYVTIETMEIFYREIVEDIAAWRAGTPIRVMSA